MCYLCKVLTIPSHCDPFSFCSVQPNYVVVNTILVEFIETFAELRDTCAFEIFLNIDMFVKQPTQGELSRLQSDFSRLSDLAAYLNETGMTHLAIMSAGIVKYVCTCKIRLPVCYTRLQDGRAGIVWENDSYVTREICQHFMSNRQLQSRVNTRLLLEVISNLLTERSIGSIAYWFLMIT